MDSNDVDFVGSINQMLLEDKMFRLDLDYWIRSSFTTLQDF